MIILKNEEEIKKIGDSGKIVAEVLAKMKEMAQPGLATIRFDEEARRITKGYGARAAFLDYHGYPSSICVSVNEVVVHGIPSRKQILKEGDIVGLDFGIELHGYVADATISVPVGKVSEKASRLLKTTEESLFMGIAMARRGNRLGDLSSAIQVHAERSGFSIVRDFVGHGVGRQLHEDPMVPNYGKPGTGIKLEVGMVLAIEPMVNEKGYEVEVLNDDWTVVTKDKGLSAHFEHTVAITPTGPMILTAL
ncbi:MAG: type I methionyl aminopeptidase [Spirochaetia bacterium]|nr:type I methionyl aminopeptidase [Spirochaetia bacterium]